MEIRESDLLFDDSYGIVNTDANGQFSAILTSGQSVGVAGVRAELLYDDGNGSRVVHADRKLMYIGITQTILPLIRR